MKKFLSIILAVVMIASLLPATFMTAAAAEGDILYDFSSWVAANKTGESPLIPARGTLLTAENSPSGLSVPGFESAIKWETANNSLRIYNYSPTWRSAQNAGSRSVVTVTVPEGGAGWYLPEHSHFGNANEENGWSMYHIAGGSYTYLGDVVNSVQKNLNPVYLSEGENKIAYCHITTGTAMFISKLNFYKLAAEPTLAVDAGDAVTIGVGSTETFSTPVTTSEGTTYEFPYFAINTSDYYSAGPDNVTYLKVEAAPAGIVEVKGTKDVTFGNATNAGISVTGLKEGTATVTITPVIGGVEKTAARTTKTVNVLDKNVIYDFAAFFAANTDAQGQNVYEAPVAMPNFAINRTGSAVETYQKWLNSSIRLGNVNGDWYTTPRNSTTGNNKVVWDITVPAGKAGWYTPALTFSANNATDTVTMYNIADGKTAYVGDFKPSSSAANAVYLYEGTNSLVLGFTGGKNTTKFVKTLSFTKLDAEPAIASVTAGAPESVSLGDTSATYTATVAMEGGSNYLFPYRGVDASFYASATAATSNYLKITASPADVVAITATNGGAGNYDKTNYTFQGLKEGTTEVTFTPVINGVEKTDKAVTKTINVVNEDIVYDFVAYVNAGKAAGTITTRGQAITGDVCPAGFGVGGEGTGTAAGQIGWETADPSARFYGVNANWGSDEPVEDRFPGTRFVMTVDVPANKAGWYTPQFKYHGNAGQEGLCSVYHIYNGEATYLGDTVNSGDNYLAPVYLEAGVNEIAVAIIRGTDGMFVEKLAFYKYEGEQATLSSISVEDPADLAVGETSVAYEITGAMSDGSAMKFPPLGMDTTTYHNSGMNTTDYIKVTATPANVVDVLAYSGGYSGMPNYYYEVKAVSEGDVVLSFVPVVDGVEKTDLKVTKNISVTHPDGNITGDSVSIWYSATDVAGAIDAEAKGLLGGNIAAGEVNNVAVGTEVTVTAEDSEELTFLYWYNGNSKRVLSDDAEYTFTAGTNTSVYAKYLAKGEEATEYFNASGALIEEAEGTFAAEPDVELGGYKLFKDTAAAVAEIATATAESADFVCWTKDGKAVSYNTTYTYAKWGNVGEAVEVTEGEKSSAPAVVLFESNGAYMLELVNFEGKTIIEKGIAFNGDIDSCTSKAVSADKNVNQFTATGDGEAVAYVIYRDGAAIRVAYSD